MGNYDTFESVCPACGEGETLIVRLVFLVATGDEVQTNAELHADGFDISSFLDEQQLQLKDLSTENEEVACSGCGEQFTLAELLLEGQQEYLYDVEATISARELVQAGSSRIALMKARRSFADRPVYDCHIENFSAQDARSAQGTG